MTILSDAEPTAPPYRLVARGETETRARVPVGEGFIGAGTFTLVAGPCAVETYDQTSAACEAAIAAGATVLRGDLYKQRTSPYSFAGLRDEGVEIVADLRRRFELPWLAEVLEPAHLEVVADVVDVLRVGSRNMQNLELLKECARSGKAVVLKRGLSATIEEWLLAAEYIASEGNRDIILCERGIRTFEPSTRNTLDLSAVAVVQRRSQLPVVVDPSHGTGSRDLVGPMALAAVAAGADGLMIDVHPQPDVARCDGAQALRPREIEALGAKLQELAAWMGREKERG